MEADGSLTIEYKNIDEIPKIAIKYNYLIDEEFVEQMYPSSYYGFADEIEEDRNL